MFDYTNKLNESLYSTDLITKHKIKLVKDFRSSKQSPFLPPHTKILKAIDENRTNEDLVGINEVKLPLNIDKLKHL